MNQIAQQLQDASEAQALRVDDLIRANELVIASVNTAALDFAKTIESGLTDQNKALAVVAASIRAGTPLLPPAPQLEPIDPEKLPAGLGGFLSADHLVSKREAKAA